MIRTLAGKEKLGHGRVFRNPVERADYRTEFADHVPRRTPAQEHSAPGSHDSLGLSRVYGSPHPNRVINTPTAKR